MQRLIMVHWAGPRGGLEGRFFGDDLRLWEVIFVFAGTELFFVLYCSLN